MSRVRRLTLAELVAGAFTVGVVYLAAVGVFVVRSVDRLSDTSERVERTHVVLRTLEEVQSIVTGSETGVRGFVITGDVRHLEPYRGAEASAAERLRTLETLTSGDPVQHDRLRLLASCPSPGRSPPPAVASEPGSSQCRRLAPRCHDQRPTGRQ